MVDASAVQLCARKVAAGSGDVRKALNVCRRAVELVHSAQRKQGLLAPFILTYFVINFNEYVVVIFVQQVLNCIVCVYSWVRGHATQSHCTVNKLSIDGRVQQS